jgi:deoxyhypusine synthase
MRRVEGSLLTEWKKAELAGESFLPHEYFYKILLNGSLKKHYQIDTPNSWLLAAA